MNIDKETDVRTTTITGGFILDQEGRVMSYDFVTEDGVREMTVIARSRRSLSLLDRHGRRPTMSKESFVEYIADGTLVPRKADTEPHLASYIVVRHWGVVSMPVTGGALGQIVTMTLGKAEELVEAFTQNEAKSTGNGYIPKTYSIVQVF